MRQALQPTIGVTTRLLLPHKSRKDHCGNSSSTKHHHTAYTASRDAAAAGLGAGAAAVQAAAWRRACGRGGGTQPGQRLLLPCGYAAGVARGHERPLGCVTWSSVCSDAMKKASPYPRRRSSWVSRAGIRPAAAGRASRRKSTPRRLGRTAVSQGGCAEPPCRPGFSSAVPARLLPL